MKSLELHYPMIQFLIVRIIHWINHYSLDKSILIDSTEPLTKVVQLVERLTCVQKS